MVKWLNLKGLTEKGFADVPKLSGVYLLRWSKNRNPIQIGRLEGTDSEGLLYIGSSSNLKNRIRQLWRGISEFKAGHTIRKTISFCKVSELIDASDYEITWKTFGNVEEARGQEWSAFKLYADKYKEPPPLNLSLRRDAFAIWDMAKFDKSKFAYEPDDFLRSIIQ